MTETVENLRKNYGLKIGSSTGYTSEIMEKLRVRLEKQPISRNLEVNINQINNIIKLHESNVLKLRILYICRR